MSLPTQFPSPKTFTLLCYNPYILTPNYCNLIGYPRHNMTSDWRPESITICKTAAHWSTDEQLAASVGGSSHRGGKLEKRERER